MGIYHGDVFSEDLESVEVFTVVGVFLVVSFHEVVEVVEFGLVEGDYFI